MVLKITLEVILRQANLKIMVNKQCMEKEGNQANKSTKKVEEDNII